MVDDGHGLRGMRVLLVEDIDLVALQIEEMLLEAGCEVAAVVGSVDDAMKAARSGDVDAAVLDINVRGGKTFGVADELKSRGVPFVFSTGDGDRYLPERFEADPQVCKPFEPEELCAALAKARG